MYHKAEKIDKLEVRDDLDDSNFQSIPQQEDLDVGIPLPKVVSPDVKMV